MTIKTASLVLCSVAVIFAQQAEQSPPQYIPPQQPVHQAQPQVQQVPQYIPPQQPVQQVPQYMPPQQPVQQVPQYMPPQQPVQQVPQYMPPQQQVQQPMPPPQQPQPQPQMQQTPQCPPPPAQTKTGLYARFNLNSVSYGFNDKKNDRVDMGIGFGGGLIRRTPVASFLDINPEIGFFHRNLFSEKKVVGQSDGEDQKTEIDEIWYDETEFVLTIIPVLAQISPFEIPLYVAIGFQADFPILAKITTTTKYKGNKDDGEQTGTYKDRGWFDLGIVWGIGYNITERFSFNFRSVVGVTSVTGKRADARTPTQYGIGVTFF